MGPFEIWIAMPDPFEALPLGCVPTSVPFAASDFTFEVYVVNPAFSSFRLHSFTLEPEQLGMFTCSPRRMDAGGSLNRVPLKSSMFLIA